MAHIPAPAFNFEPKETTIYVTGSPKYLLIDLEGGLIPYYDRLWLLESDYHKVGGEFIQGSGVVDVSYRDEEIPKGSKIISVGPPYHVYSIILWGPVYMDSPSSRWVALDDDAGKGHR